LVASASSSDQAEVAPSLPSSSSARERAVRTHGDKKCGSVRSLGFELCERHAPGAAVPRVAKPLPLLGRGSTAEAGGGSGSAAPRGPTGCCSCRKHQRQRRHFTSRQRTRNEAVSAAAAAHVTVGRARAPRRAERRARSCRPPEPTKRAMIVKRRGERSARRLRFCFLRSKSAPLIWLYAFA